MRVYPATFKLAALASPLSALALAAAWGALSGEADGQAPPPRLAALAGDASRGEALYRTRCIACHSLDANRIGPSHRGVFGRRVASVPGFRYSRALASRNVVWDAQNLDSWLANPTAFAPGTAMGFRVSAPRDRADIIAYLRTQR
jgi:cytochrome c